MLSWGKPRAKLEFAVSRLMKAYWCISSQLGINHEEYLYHENWAKATNQGFLAPLLEGQFTSTPGTPRA